jgi:hypothetical protein
VSGTCARHIEFTMVLLSIDKRSVMLTLCNYKSIEVLRNLFSSAVNRFENLVEDKEYFSNSNLSYYKVAIECADTFRNLGFFDSVDDVIYYLEKPYKFQEELHLINCLGLSTVYKLDYTEWLKENDIPKDCEMDVVDVIQYILNNQYSIFYLKDLIDELENDFSV